ncbi:anaerobic sulfite reductase subunit AsrB [Clostridium sp. NSJ-49]|uniref:anaerobic sulfite reductase subunit AsrB n=1 Tax=Clostridium TaxID=1485 RepID=UPI00164AA8EA|nr:anaerobic sulfite reductase subunit AsrB [Clostridium sp. NSJ-49]MBC5626533.1 anaerobic sulfite reductase subunit AsrB [Clostridium sp. NSJ-49]
MENLYIPKRAKILKIIKHTDKEWTFRVYANSKDVRPGQFYEISMPKHGESPISVSWIGENTLDFTIRAVGKVTDEIFKLEEGDNLLIRGPYGNGFDVNQYKDKEIIIVSGGSGLAPVRGIIEYFYNNYDECKGVTLICGFRSPNDVLFVEDIRRYDDKMNVILTVDGADSNYDGNIGLVTKYIPELKIKNIDNVAGIVVGPPMMMKFAIIELQKLGIKDEDLWVSYERKMSCGLGKCGHCKMDSTYICVDGPVFNFSFGKTLYD